MEWTETSGAAPRRQQVPSSQAADRGRGTAEGPAGTRTTAALAGLVSAAVS